MSSTQSVHLPDGKRWAVGSFIVSKACVIVPINEMGEISNEDLGKFVRALSRNAARCLAEEIAHDWEYHKHAPADWVYSVVSILTLYEDDPAVYHTIRLLLDHTRAKPQRTKPKKKSVSRDGYVYLAYADTGHYKIGYSTDPEARIKHFDTQMPVAVETVHTFPTDDMRRTEAELHERFADKRVNGEWFELDSKDVEFIKGIGQDDEHIQNE